MRKEFTRFIVTIFYSLIGLAVLVSMSCGGGGGSSASTPATTPNSPQISGLQYTPQTANLNEGNGAITITAIINFTDPDGDVATVTINKYGAQETTLLSTNTYPIQNISGLVSGSITIIGQIRTTTVQTSFSRNTLRNANPICFMV